MNERTKITLEEIVNPKEIQLLRSIECPIDNMVPLENHAVVCKKCETIYCKDCIEVWKKNSNICPMRCSPMELIRVEITIVGQELQKIRIKCKNEIYGCDEKVLLKECSKHESECPYRQEECTSCQTKKSNKLMRDHLLKECEVLKLSCFVCSNKLFLGEIYSHVTKCMSTHVYCDICNEFHHANPDFTNNNSNPKVKCKLQIQTCSKCNLPELSYLIGTPEHICLNEKSNLHISLNNYLLQLSVRVHKAMEKAQKERAKINSAFLNGFKETIKKVQRVYFNKTYQLNNRVKKVHEDYKKRIQVKINNLKESNQKISDLNSTTEEKIASKYNF